MSFTAFENLDETDSMNAGTDDSSAGTAAPAGTEAAAATATVPVVAPNKIRKVQVYFDTARRDANHRVMPHGFATATYGDGSTLTVEVTGGAHVPTYGITDAVLNHPVIRIENAFYKNHKGQPMPYAVFYNGGEALHVGKLDHISHGCVHVGDSVKMEQLNKGAVTGKTKVSVNYGPGVLDKIWNQHM